MTDRPDLLKNAVIIAAHPDDEILWFSSVMKQAQNVILLYRNARADAAIGDRRAEVISNMPHPNVTWLELTESGSIGCADWAQPGLTDHGLALTTTATLRDLKSLVKKALPMSGPVPDMTIQAAYEANFNAIVDRLRPLLSADMNVFTHNPWGEYGHEEHVQCFRAVDLLRREIGFKLWMSNYCTDRSLPLAQRYFFRERPEIVRLPTDAKYAGEIARLYMDAGCWTWIDDWAWFDDECFMEAPRGPLEQAEAGCKLPLNVFSL